MKLSIHFRLSRASGCGYSKSVPAGIFPFKFLMTFSPLFDDKVRLTKIQLKNNSCIGMVQQEDLKCFINSHKTLCLHIVSLRQRYQAGNAKVCTGSKQLVADISHDKKHVLTYVCAYQTNKICSLNKLSLMML